MKSRIFKFSFFIFHFSFLLFAACGKDNTDVRLRIFTENMTNGNSAKVLVDPDNINGASWVSGERINLNGTAYPVAYDENSYYLNTGSDDISGSLLAVYPADPADPGNDVTVTMDGATGTVTIRSLCVDYRGGNGGHRILFPMAASNDKSDMRLLFNHLTAGMRLTLTDTCSAKDYTIGSVKIVTYGDNAYAGALEAVNGVSCNWAVQGPAVPGGMIGEEAYDVNMAYSSEMRFTLKDNGTAGKAIATGDSISLCVPVTVNRIKTLIVTGYDTDGQQLFTRTKTLDDELTVQRNTMYTIPEIKF